MNPLRITDYMGVKTYLPFSLQLHTKFPAAKYATYISFRNIFYNRFLFTFLSMNIIADTAAATTTFALCNINLCAYRLVKMC